MAIFIALVFMLLLPASPSNPTSLLLPKISLFTERERLILINRVVSDDKAKAQTSNRIQLKRDIVQTLLNWRQWSHYAIGLLACAPNAALPLYAPKLIQGFQFESRSPYAANPA